MREISVKRRRGTRTLLSTSKSATNLVKKRRPVQKYLKLLRLSSIRPMPFATDDPVYENWVRSTGSASSSLRINTCLDSSIRFLGRILLVVRTTCLQFYGCVLYRLRRTLQRARQRPSCSLQSQNCPLQQRHVHKVTTHFESFCLDQLIKIETYNSGRGQTLGPK